VLKLSAASSRPGTPIVTLTQLSSLLPDTLEPNQPCLQEQHQYGQKASESAAAEPQA
jgi:hypothetical protein